MASVGEDPVEVAGSARASVAHVIPMAHPAREVSRRRKGQVVIQGPRSLSRGRSVPGRRHVNRWLNDNFVPAYGNVWATLEPDFLERLEHATLVLEHQPLMKPLEGHATLLRAFRHGVIGAESLASKRRADAEAARSNPSVRSLLASMYARVDARIRPIVLKEARRALRPQPTSVSTAVSAPPGCTFISDMEIMLQRFMDGAIALDLTLMQCDMEALGRKERSPASAASADETATLRFSAELLRGLAALPILSTRTSASGRPMRVMQLSLVDGYSRLLTLALCQFYGLQTAARDEGECKYLSVSVPAVAAAGMDCELEDGRAHPHRTVAALRTKLESMAGTGGLFSRAPGDASAYQLPPTSRSRSRSMRNARRRIRDAALVPPSERSDESAATGSAGGPSEGVAAATADADITPEATPTTHACPTDSVNSIAIAVSDFSLGVQPVPTCGSALTSAVGEGCDVDEAGVVSLPVVPLLLIHVRSISRPVPLVT